MVFFPSFCAVYTWRGKEKKKKRREFFSSYHSTCDSDRQRRETDTNQFVVVTAEYILRDNQKLFSSSCGMQW